MKKNKVIRTICNNMIAAAITTLLIYAIAVLLFGREPGTGTFCYVLMIILGVMTGRFLVWAIPAAISRLKKKER